METCRKHFLQSEWKWKSYSSPKAAMTPGSTTSLKYKGQF